jgi:hypothetical protein
MRPVLAAITAALLIGVGVADAQPPSAPAGPPVASQTAQATVTRSGHQLIVSCNQTEFYNCDIVPATIDDVRRAFAAPDGGAIDTMLVQETGGEIDANLALGRLIHQHKLTVEVHRACVALCAIVVAPAAAHLVIPKGSGLVFVPLHSTIQKMTANMGSQGADILKALDAKFAAYFQELNLDPQIPYGIGEAALVVKAALAAGGGTQEPVIVADSAFLHNCLRIPAVEMQDYTMAQMKEHLGQDGKAPLAYLVKGKIYFDGKPVVDYDPPCGR